MFRNVLIAVDLTESSEPALRAGLDLMRTTGAAGAVVYVAQPPYPPQRWFEPVPDALSTLEDLSKREQEAARRILVTEIERLGGPGQKVEVVVRRGIPADEILTLAAERGAELIVMGTHGRRGLQHLMLGSIAERVVRNAPCAVMTVRPPK